MYAPLNNNLPLDGTSLTAGVVNSQQKNNAASKGTTEEKRSHRKHGGAGRLWNSNSELESRLTTLNRCFIPAVLLFVRPEDGPQLPAAVSRLSQRL